MMELFLQRNLTIAFLVFLYLPCSFGQFVFPPGSIWEFDHSQITWSGPFEGYSKWEATDRDTLYKGEIWQVFAYFRTTMEYKSTKIDSLSGEIFLRKDGLWLAGAGLPKANGDRDTFHYIWLLDGENPGVGQTFHTPGDFCPGIPITILEVDTVELMGHDVQRYTYFEWGDTFRVYPYPGLIEREDKYLQHAYYGSQLFLPLPELLCVTDAPYSWLACFTFPDGTKWVNRSNCGKLFTSFEEEDKDQISWTLTPNPSTGITQLSGPAFFGNLHLRLFTSTGAEAASFILPFKGKNAEFDVSSIPPGWYLLEIYNASELIQARIPFIKG